MAVGLGLDVGDRRIGVAKSDPEGRIAVPIFTIHRVDEEATLNEMERLVKEHSAEYVVVGVPNLLSGVAGEQAARVEEFARLLENRLRMPVERWDERLTTFSAQRMMRDAGTRRNKRKEHVDSLAAALILQGYMDSKRTYDPLH